MSNLNGWQRLWVFLSLLFAVLLFVLNAVFLEPEEWYGKSNDASNVISFNDIPFGTKEIEIPGHGTATFPAFMTDAEINEVVQRKFSSPTDTGLLQIPKTKMWLFMGIIWLVTCVSIYILGWFVAWIARGFKSNSLSRENLSNVS